MRVIDTGQLARIEGNANIVATIDKGEVKDVSFFINEGPRLVERLTVGKTPEEVANIAPRICSICSASHKLASLRALENALSVKPPPKVLLLRELLHLGEMIESHSLHTYYLALPDYLGYPSAIAMAEKYNLEVKIALEMKQFGNQIIKTISGRFIHGENTVIGGFGTYPARDDLIGVRRRAIQFMPFTIKTVTLFNEISYPEVPEADTIFACLNPAGERFGFMGEEVLISTGEKLDIQKYRRLTNEEVKPHSFCKRSRYNGRPFTVGALARVTLLGERLEGEAGSLYRKYYSSRWKRNPLYNNAAQAIEILYAMERIPRLIDEINSLPDEPPATPIEKEGSAAGALEAPRGTLYHAYTISGGVIVNSDIITPTAQNAEDIEEYCFEAARKLLSNGEEEKILSMLNLIVRAYDPCVSCSVHLIKAGKVAPERIVRNPWQFS